MLLRYIMVFSKMAIVLCTVAVKDPQDNCMVSLMVPKESLKTVCTGGSDYQTDQKLKSVESQLNSIRHDIGRINVRLTYTLNHGRDNGEISKRLEKLENSVTNIQTNLTRERDTDRVKEVVVETFNRKRIVRLIKSTLRKEMGEMKEEIKRDIHYEFRQQLKHDIRNELNSYMSQNSKFLDEFNTEILLNRAGGYDSKRDYDPSSKVEKHNTKEMANNNKRHVMERYDTTDSAFNNELPEKPQSKIFQSDSESTKDLDIKDAIVILNSEVKKHLDKQTSKVKEIVGQHLNQTQVKLNKLSENFDKKLDSKYVDVFKDNKGYQDISGRIEQMEHAIETLGNGLSSLLHDNMLSGEIKRTFELEKVAMENRLLSKLSSESYPIKLEIENLKNQTISVSNLIQATSKSARQTQFSLQIFNATVKHKHYNLERSIKQMTEQINKLNETLNPDYEDTFDFGQALNEIDIQNAVDFVHKMKDTWPSVLHNITSLVQDHKKDFDFIQEGFEHITYKFSDVYKNQTECLNKIDKVNRDIKEIQENIVYNERIKTEDALDKNQWAQFNFNHTFSRSGCYGGKKYVKKTGYDVGIYVGVVLCSEKRYKIYLSDSLNGTFLNIGDTIQNGEDHCEFVGASKNSPVKLGKGATDFSRIPGYRRRNWGEVPIRTQLSFFSPTPLWYECGVTIP
ncbi:uncharacterized protein LOC132717041 [Ruditapes philippinarum]|uniref:uncharacterized protein LOC132717041 n=1 Tax=Ruditapes philippinarum TaxID=129788 RepID=UPI00295B7A3C|nr:uncharacterized protein LOC132717041 [Ruditapes philippinarum]XP_060556408.1 uncharacterized protein LOC132717041 [Ruditapes philippinarum]XP_060556409.1 uncharacterized protein LOC132717041 [Ruditapes philippinarum]